MNIFISWSGIQSRKIAHELSEWLGMVIPGATRWLSEEKVELDSRWMIERANNFKDAQFFIIILTPENFRSPWLYFEAGAISANKVDAQICGYLVGVDLSQLQGGPLSQFQSVQANKGSTWQLVNSINSRLEQPIDVDQLSAMFNLYWPDFKRKLDKILIETVATGIDKETEALKPVYRLSDEEAKLLKEAASDPHGQVLMVRTLQGLFVQANRKQLVQPMNARTEATWRGTIRDLVIKGLLDAVGSKGEVFNVTAEGYRVADALKSTHAPASGQS